MADRNDASSSTISQGGARVESTANAGGEHAMNVMGEFMEAARSAAESLLEEQKRRAAEQVSIIGEALRSAAQSLDKSQNRAIARYAGQAADQIENFSSGVRERGWNEILANTEDFARRQPTFFVLAAVATGFVAGRFLWATTGGRRYGNATRGSSNLPQARSETARAVTAAVSSGSGAGGAGVAGAGAGTAGTLEAR